MPRTDAPAPTYPGARPSPLARGRAGAGTTRGLFLLFAALFTAGLGAPPPAAADLVVIHNRGNKIKLEGAQAQELIRLCADIVRQAESRNGSIPTDYVRYLRANEVVVEVHYDEPQSLELRQPNERDHAQHIFVALTGDLTGSDGDGAQALTGRTAPRNEPRYLGIDYYNPPDEYGVQYGVMYFTRGGLTALRQAVAQLGIEAPRPTPKPTEVLDRSPVPVTPLSPTPAPAPE